MDILKQILGEADEHAVEERPETDPKLSDPRPQIPQESEIDEIASMWQAGNRNEVVGRFMQMDNQTAVKLVFAIGHKGALELARMTDEMLEASGEHEGQATTEPAEVEPAPAHDSISDLIGTGTKNHEQPA